MWALLQQRSPAFSAAGTGFVKDNFFSWTVGGVGFKIIQVHYINCAIYLYYYYISSTSDHQTLDPRGGGPLILRKGKPFLLAKPSCELGRLTSVLLYE